jgi:hypothetical protein
MFIIGEYTNALGEINNEIGQIIPLNLEVLLFPFPFTKKLL